MIIEAELIEELPVSNMLGENIQWRSSDQSVWWTDILGCMLYQLNWRTKKLQTYIMPEPLGSFAFTNNPSVLMAAFATGFAFFNVDTQNIKWLHQPDFLSGEGRFNDGRADRQGRFWCGTMMANPGNDMPATGRLFCVDNDRTLTSHIDGINISNGLCWSPDSKTLYFADSLLGEIYQYDFDSVSGVLANKSVFAKAPKGGSPDGATVDAAGNVWSAHWGLGKIFSFNPAGAVIAEIPVPTNQPSCVTFGGENLDLLFVTSAQVDLSADDLAGEPAAGNVFVYKTNVTGLPESQYIGE